MKKIFLSLAILLSCFTIKTASAQLHVSVGINIGSQPAWGPVGYNYANYYYLPDIDSYYDVPTHQYVYYENNVWVHRAYLPVRYRDYNVYNGYKVVINDRNPWVRNDQYRVRYGGYAGRHDQVIIRNSRDTRYANYWRGDHDRGFNDHQDSYRDNRGRHQDFHEDRRDKHDNRGGDNGNHGGGRENHGNDNGNHGSEHDNHGDGHERH